MTHLVTYATAEMSISAEILKRSARANGVDKVYQWNRAALLQTDFYWDNVAILDQPRGSGYWLWKPYIILDLMNRLPDNEIIIYSDAGVEFIAPVNDIINRMGSDIWLFGNKFSHVDWCKGDILDAILPDSQYGWLNSSVAVRWKQVQASVIFCRVSNKSKAFVKEWLLWCQMPGLIDDSPSKTPNYHTFSENRHDQAIIASLAIRDSLPLHWWPAMYNAGNFTYEKTGYTDNYPVLFHHHRRRNHEWTLTDPLNQHITNYFKRKYPDLV